LIEFLEYGCRKWREIRERDESRREIALRLFLACVLNSLPLNLFLVEGERSTAVASAEKATQFETATRKAGCLGGA
jgi:hypothetical protein